jgi:hypothetical protein
MGPKRKVTMVAPLVDDNTYHPQTRALCKKTIMALVPENTTVKYEGI